MISTSIASALALILLGLLFRTKNSGPSQIHRQSRVLMTAVQIVCGDCSGDAERPVRTCLNESAACERCGGTSYVIASQLAANSLRLRAVRVGEGGRVLAFESPLSSHRIPIARIAV